MFLKRRTTNKNIKRLLGPMIPVAKAQGITIHSPPQAIVAFHSSPYPVHVQGGAIDIFGSREFGTFVLSPISGEVTLIDKSKVGRARYFKTEPYDYIFVIKNDEACVRMLHMEPEIEIGENVKVGDKIGRYIRTPLLPFWSYPHVHVEVKDCSDTQSPLNAYPLKRLDGGNFHGTPDRDYVNIEAKVQLATKNYVIVSPLIDIFGAIGNYWGVAVEVGDEFCLLDAQTPWNCYGGLALSENSRVDLDQEVKFGGVSLGKVVRVHGKMATYALGGELGDGIDRYSKGLLYRDVNMFNVPYKRIKVNEEVFLGISTGLSLFENREVRLIPLKPLEREYEVGEELEIMLDVEG